MTPSSLKKLLCLPDSYPINDQTLKHIESLKKIEVYQDLIQLELMVQPIISNIQDNGISVHEAFFETVLPSELSAIDKLREQGFFSEERASNKKRGLENWSFDYLTKKGCGINDQGHFIMKGIWSSYSSYTGRIYVKKLPLTNIPKIMKPYLKSNTGRNLISIDLNAAELRVAAYYSQDAKLLSVFENGMDIHEVNSHMLSAVTSIDSDSMRAVSKKLVFSLLYGSSQEKLFQDLIEVAPNVSQDSLEDFIKEFNTKYPVLIDYLSSLSRKEHIQTPFGDILPKIEMSITQRYSYPHQICVSVLVKYLIIICNDLDIDVVHVIHDEVLISTVSPDKIAQIKELFSSMVDLYIPGFPVEGILVAREVGNEDV